MFSGAFVAATIFPGGSELLLTGFLSSDPERWKTLVIVASIGNTLGALTNYALGLLGQKAFSSDELEKKSARFAVNLVHKYGYWALLLSWLPLIGDVLCVFAGWVKCPFLPSLLMITIGKTLRYLFIASIALLWF
ncbi:DedA family protein [Parashewanella spongiae]|uniref:DedA family protein n=1 Tax=Parashewanella spongiae TaxID=342950 RepID=A0A3A6U203_9GAMM|nr:YqaA family protein [Parashewanella spongiae]MCL1077783.1 DedA family protein [Parashewanella spongiae]RJY18041.1 DedA family protein [Parashewanella spongiae]